MAGEAHRTVEQLELEPRIPTRSRIALACLGLPPALIAVLQLGRLHPDEVYQALEPAHHVAFGKGVISWEWEEGLRNWALPGAFGYLLKLAAWLGIDDPQARRAVLELPQYALHALSLAAVYRLIRRHAPAVSDPWRLLGVSLVALYAPVLHYAGRTLSESISTAFLLWGLERADARGLRARSYVLGGALLGLAVVVRYGSAVIALIAVLYLVSMRRVRAAAFVALGGSIVACLLGLLDLASWDAPFHSLRAYVDYNVLSGKAAKVYGTQPASFYGIWLAKALPAWFWPALGLGVYHWQQRRRNAEGHATSSGLLYACAIAYVAAISFTLHKEERFLYPALVVLLAAALPALIATLAGLRRWAGATGLALALAAGLVLLAFPSTRFSPRATEQFRLFVSGVRSGTGVVITKSGLWGAPGFFYAARRPWRLCGDSPSDACTLRAIKSPKFNRVVGYKLAGEKQLRARGFEILEQQGRFTLWGRD